AAAQDPHVGEDPLDAGARQDRAALLRFEPEREQAARDVAHALAGLLPREAAPARRGGKTEGLAVRRVRDASQPRLGDRVHAGMVSGSAVSARVKCAASRAAATAGARSGSTGGSRRASISSGSHAYGSPFRRALPSATAMVARSSGISWKS